jgi:uncharacterized membrane protein YqaE (UPF0057 family)
MKRLLVSVVLFAVGLLSACDKQTGLTLTKRHYRSGYYVYLGGRTRTHIAAITARQVERIADPIQTIETKQVNYITSKPVAITNAKPNVFQKVLAVKRMFLRNDTKVNSVSVCQNNFIRNRSVIDNLQRQSTHEKNVEVPFAAIVVCAIFIPPLGVGLMYGIDDYFWIDLVLTLLFFLPGMIFALVVVLS